MKVERVDPLRRTIRVEEQLVEVGGHVQWGPPKTKAGRRTVTMPAAIAELVGEHMGTASVRASGLVFPTLTGQPMRRSNFRKLWQRAVAAAGLPVGLVFHELRHTAAALAIAQGAHPLAIRDRLGHSSITVTMDVYGGLFPSLDEAIAEGLDTVLRGSLLPDAADRMRTGGTSATPLRRSAQ